MMGPGDMAEIAYRAGLATWDIGEPQPVITQLIALGAIRGHVLDPGCGTGWHAIEYARASCTVTGIDVAPTAVHRARLSAQVAGVEVDFRTADVTWLEGFDGQFDTIVDSKCLDNLEGADTRHRYLKGLHRASRPGARLFGFTFAHGSINGCHNHLVPDLDLGSTLPAAGFDIDYIGPTTYELEIRDWRPLCPTCPPRFPDGRMTIPMTEVHATRSDRAPIK